MKKFISTLLAISCTASLCFSTTYATETAEDTLLYGDYLSYQTVDENSDGTSDFVRITDCDTSAVEVEIPAEIDDLPVTEIGDRAFEYCYSLTDIAIPDSVNKIGEFTFYCCENLTNVNIPYGITEIEDFAFGDCYSLEEITIPDSVTRIGDSAFFSCTSITEIVIPDSVTEMDDYAFFGCSKLTDVTISENLTSLEQQVFSFCSSLKSIHIPDSVTKLGACLFWESPIEEVNVHERITVFERDAFRATPWLEAKLAENPMLIINDILVEAKTCEGDVIVPDGVKTIAESAFAGSDITGISISDSVTAIADSAFKNCDELTEITLPDTITSLGTYIFSDCDKLENISIPSDISELPDGLFSGCKSLKEMTLPENITEIPRNLFNCCYALTEVNIPESVTTISDHAFYKCTNLENISIPTTVDSVDYWAFYNTKWLENKKAENPLVIVNNVLVDGTTCSGKLVIPENVTKISGYAFEACAGLEKITIPEQVTEIGESAFYGCTNLTDIVIENPDCAIDDSANVFTNSWGYPSPMGMIPGEFNGIIYCHENSTAHEYAVKFERAYSIIGSNIVYDPIVPEPITTYIDPAKTSTVTWTSYTTVSQVSSDAPQESVTPETSPVSTTAISTMTILPTATTTSSLSELTTTTTTTSINEPTTTTSEATEKIYDINNEAYRNYVDSLGEKIAYEEEFVAYLNKAYTLTEDCAITHVYNAVGNENVTGVNSRRYFVESIIPGTNEKARKFEKISFYWGTSDEDEYAFGFSNYEEIFGGDYVANAINTYLEEKNLNAHVVTVEKGGSPAKKVVHYDDTSEENIVATFLAINEKFGAEVIAYPNAMEFADIFYDDSILVGDANGDDELNVRDCAFIASKLADNDTESISKTADYNTDGRIDVRDAAAIAKTLASAENK